VPPKKRKQSLGDLRKAYSGRDASVSGQLLTKLRRDPRQGARQLYKSLLGRFNRQREERLRQDAMLHFERLLWKSGVRDIAGVDEVGIGPLAGPVVAAAVMFAPETKIAGIDDSKRLDPEIRAALAVEIREKASAVGLGLATVTEIDTVNIYHAGLLAMRRAIEALPRRPQHVLVDARTIPGVDLPQSSYNKGDGINFSIAAASIIAKTERDRIMDGLDREYPGYGFASHKGYATSEHRAALKRLGPSPVHRMSFPVIGELRGEWSAVFYHFRVKLDEVQGAAALRELEAALTAQQEALAEREYQKLRLLIVRRWKLLSNSRNA
jgi:ribonuclease HII